MERQDPPDDDGASGTQEWFPWADHQPDGTLAVAWDRDDAAPDVG